MRTPRNTSTQHQENPSEGRGKSPSYAERAGRPISFKLVIADGDKEFAVTPDAQGLKEIKNYFRDLAETFDRGSDEYMNVVYRHAAIKEQINALAADNLIDLDVRNIHSIAENASRILQGAESKDALELAFRRVAELIGLDDLVMPHRRNARGFALPSALPDKARLLYRDRPKDMDFVGFINAVWRPYIEAGLLSRPDLKRLDPGAYKALANFLTKGNVLPDDLKIPTVTEAIDRKVAGLGNVEEKVKLVGAIKGREQRARQRSPS